LEINYTKKINVFVWPEWWFSTKEISQFEENNFKKVFLWNRILRTETTSSVTWFYIIQTKN
jgi:RsmE family RNA methyltransferase